MAFFKKSVDAILSKFHSLKQELEEVIENNSYQHEVYELAKREATAAQGELKVETLKAKAALEHVEKFLGVA